MPRYRRLWAGAIRTKTSETDLGALEPGKRWVLFRDGSVPAHLEIEPAHREHMLGLDLAHPDFFGPR